MKDIMEIAKVDIQSTLGTITSNLKDVKIKLDEEFAGLEDKKVTAEDLPLAKDSIAQARKIYTAIENKRKSIKKEWNVPYVEFENELKLAMDSLTKYINNIKEQIDELETQEKVKKMEEVNLLIQEKLEDKSESVRSFINKINWLVNPRWENKTYSMKKIEEEIDTLIIQISNDLSIISGFDSDIYNALMIEYTKSGNLSQTLILKDTLIAQKQEQERLRAEMQKAREEVKEPVVEVKEEYKSVTLTNDNWDNQGSLDFEEPQEVVQETVSTPNKPELEYLQDSDYQKLEVTYKIVADKAIIRLMKDMARFYGANIEMVGTPKVV